MREGPEGREIYLPTLEREFKHQDVTYILKIKPARAEDRHGNEVEYYPSEQEEIVEEALRKLACDRLNGVYLGPGAGVQFTMYELREELRKRGHAMSHDELQRSLLICRSAGLHIEKKGGEKEVIAGFQHLSHCDDFEPQGLEGRPEEPPVAMCSSIH